MRLLRYLILNNVFYTCLLLYKKRQPIVRLEGKYQENNLSKINDHFGFINSNGGSGLYRKYKSKEEDCVNEQGIDCEKDALREDMWRNEELEDLITERNLKIPYVVEYPIDRVSEEPDMSKEDVAKSIMWELGFFNDTSKYQFENKKENFKKDYESGSNGNKDNDRMEFNYTNNNNKENDGNYDNKEHCNYKDQYNDYENRHDEDQEDENYENEQDKDNDKYNDNKDNGGKKELVLLREELKIGSKGGAEAGDYDGEEEITKDYLVRTSAVDRISREEEDRSPSILEEEESPVVGKHRVRWFPNHVSKSLSKLHDYLKMADVIVDVRDGRMPYIPPNDYLFRLFESEFPTKPRITVFTHSDSLPKIAMAEWMRYYRLINKNITRRYNENIKKEDEKRVENKTMFVDARNGLKEIIYLKKHMYKMCRKKMIKNIERGIKPKPIKAIVVGMPNVGKSALINRIIGRRVARSYDVPGITREINIYKEESKNKIKKITMIDTPGFICPVYEDQRFPNSYKNIFKRGKTGENQEISKRKEREQMEEKDRKMLIYSGLNIISEAACEVDEVAIVILEEIIKMMEQKPKYIESSKIKRKYPLLASLIDGRRSNGENEKKIFESERDLETEISAKIDRLATWLFGGNLNSCCSKFLSDFRKGNLGEIMLQSPPMGYNYYINYLPGKDRSKIDRERRRGREKLSLEYTRGIYEGW